MFPAYNCLPRRVFCYCKRHLSTIKVKINLTLTELDNPVFTDELKYLWKTLEAMLFVVVNCFT